MTNWRTIKTMDDIIMLRWIQTRPLLIKLRLRSISKLLYFAIRWLALHWRNNNNKCLDCYESTAGEIGEIVSHSESGQEMGLLPSLSYPKYSDE